ncbi:alanine--tRNA ligase, partial [Candidatus Woesearchaeota archaeon]|nr:alanine--tRNA ligase [Candidatus Woesearchaeota archaeon]
KGYKVMDRYPVVARWNPTMEFTIASIAAFQPYVVNGEVEAPAKSLVIPQFCLRFGDIDNVGITMSHMTGFVMIGQHMFVPPKEWDQEKAFRDILDWLTDGLGLPKKEITFHEDAWAGGGNFGPCMEYFSRGVELGNQVYMMFEQTPNGPKELKLKVLDMGMGHERNAWFSQGKGTIYDATFPYTIKHLKKVTKVEYDEELMQRYIPHAAYLNIDEVEDIAEAWKKVAGEMKMGVDELRKAIEPMTAIYSVAEHARSLLLALADGGLPSNVGGGYNLRVIYRRAESYIERFGWEVDMGEVCSWHAKELRELFPELNENIDDVRKILAVEKRKYLENKKKNKQIITQVLKKGLPSVEKLIGLYDSNGIPPEQVVAAAKELGKELVIPDNFFQLVAERHEQSEQKTATKKQTYYAVDDLPNTKIMYYGAHDAVV